VKTISLPVIAGVTETIAANGTVPETLLSELAAMLSLPIREYELAGSETAVEIIDREDCCPQDNWLPWQGWGRYPATLKLSLDQHRLRVLVPSAEVLKEVFRIRILRRVLYFPLLRHLALRHVALMHGALLESPDCRKGSVLFAESGMGKSTTALRYAEQGGVCVSDDRLLLVFAPNGEICARPLPTWKFFPDIPPLDFSREIRITGFFMLFRGEDDRIEKAPVDNWHIALCKSLTDTLVTPRLWLPAQLRGQFLSDSLWPMELLEKRFGCYQLCGDLNGHVFRHISEFTERNALS